MRRFSLLLALALAGCGGTETTSTRSGQLACADCDVADDGTYRIDFGNVILGDYLERTVTVENRGSTTLKAAFPGLQAPFSCAGCEELELAPAATARVTFGFAPSAEGLAAADFAVQGDGKAPARFHLGGTGAEAQFDCTPQLVEFGGWRVDTTSSPVKITCTNTATLSLTLVVQPAASPFATTAEPREVVVDPGRALEIPVTFAPTRAGDALGKVEITSQGRLQVAQIALAGEGLEHVLDVPEALDLGYVTLGTARTLAVTLRNLSAATAHVTGIAVEGAGPFTAGSSAPLDVEPRRDAEVQVTFTPADYSEQTGALVITVDDPGGQREVHRVALRGAGGGPVIACVPGSRAFGITAVGSPRTLPVTCTNTGYDHPDTLDDGLVIASATSASAAFTAVVRAHQPLQVGESVVVDVTYAPGAEATDAGAIELASSDSATPVLSVPVSGEGRTFAPCTFDLAPAELEFGKVPPGQELQLAVRVRNLGAADCLAGDPRLLPGSSDSFLVPELPARVVAAGDQLLLPVRYAPQASGEHRARLAIHVNGAAPQEVPLHGSSATPCLLLRPAPLDFGKVAPGCATQVRYLEMENRCDGPVVVESVTTAAGATTPFAVEPASFPITVLEGDFHEVGLRYHPEGGLVKDDAGAAFVQLRGEGEPWAVGLTGRAEGDPVQEELFVQHESPTVDVLFVVDAQPGMEEPIAKLASSAVRESFLGYAREQQIDFHVGVTNASVIAGASCVADGRLLPLSGTRFLTPRSDVDGLWASTLAPASCSFGKAQGMEAALRAVTPPVATSLDDPRHPEPADGNEGFLRRNAHLALVFVSSDDDRSSGTVASYLTAFRSTKAARKGNLLSAHAVIHPPGAVCSGTRAEGMRYAELVQATFGEVASVCSSDWPGSLDRIGRAAFGYEQCFELTNLPEGTGSPDGWFTLRVGGKIYPALGSRGERRWEYVAEQNAICFRPLSIPEPGVEVQVAYGVACLP